MVDLDKQFAAMADVSEEDTAYDFVIDEDLRVIAVPERGVVLGVEGDKDANRIRFRMNKTWRGYDMSKFDLRINYQNANGDKNYYTVTSKHTAIILAGLMSRWNIPSLWIASRPSKI